MILAGLFIALVGAVEDIIDSLGSTIRRRFRKGRDRGKNNAETNVNLD